MRVLTRNKKDPKVEDIRFSNTGVQDVGTPTTQPTGIIDTRNSGPAAPSQAAAEPITPPAQPSPPQSLTPEQSSVTAPPPSPPVRHKRPLSSLTKRIIIASIILLLLGGGGFAFFFIQRDNLANRTENLDEINAAERFDTVQLPVDELSGIGGLQIDGSRTLTVNGQLRVNNSLTITPAAQPTTAVAGQLYYDQTKNVLSYYNGTEFVDMIDSDDTVQNIDGVSGNIALGGGLTITGNTLSNTGVLSVQGQTGDVIFTSGGGLAIDGTTLTNTGVLSLGGQSGAIGLGNGLSMTNGALNNTGVLDVVAGSSNLVISRSNGTVTISDTGGGGGTVSSPGGTAGRIAKFTGVQTIADSLLSESGTTVTVNGDLSVTGALSLSIPLSVGNGGTGSTTASGARANLGAAASGANSDITSISGLTTALSVIQGGTGVSSLANNGVVIGQGTGALTAVTAGASGLCLVSTAGAPAWQVCPGGGGGGVTSLNGLTGGLTLANATGAGTTITIDDASTTTKGIAQFNSTNFSVVSGVVNTIQNINAGATPTFAGINTNNITPSSTLTIGATGQALVMQGNSSTTLSATSGINSTTVSFQAPTDNVTYRFATAVAGTYDVCTTVGNCVGTGGGVTTSGGTTNRLAKFTGSQAINDSTITDDGVSVTTSVDAIIQGGDLTVGTTGQLGSIVLHDGNGQSTTVQAGDASGNLTFVLPTVAGTANQCIKKGSGNQLVFDDCDGGAGGSSATLQTAYNNGNSITTTDARDIDIVLANTTTDSNFDLVTADGSSGFVSFSRANGAGTADPAQMLLINNLDADRALPIGLNFQSAAGGITTAIDASDADIVTALNVGGNDIVGTTGAINFTNFDVSGAGAVTAAADINTAGGTLQTNSTTRVDNSGNLVNIGNITGTGALTLQSGGATTLTLDSGGAAGINIGGTNTNALTLSRAGVQTTIQGSATFNERVTVGNGAGNDALSFTEEADNPACAAGDYLIWANSSDGTLKKCQNGTISDLDTTGGGAGTLQDAYNNGNTISTTNARDIAFTLADTATDSSLTVTTATGSTSQTRFILADGAGTTPPSELVLIHMQDTDLTLADGIDISVVSGGIITDAIDASDAGIVNAINIGSNDILSNGVSISSAELNLLNGHDVALVDTNDAVATAIVGTGALNSGSITSGFGAIDVGADPISTTGTVSAGTSTTSGNATVGGTLGVTGTTTLSGDLAANGNTTLGNATTDRLTVTAQLLGGSPLVFQGVTDNAFTTTLAVTDPTANQVITLPDETGTVCLQNSTNCGFALSSGSGSYIQNQSAVDQTADFRISGTGRANTSLLTPLLDTATAVALNIGSTNATAINLNQNTSITGTLAVSSNINTTGGTLQTNSTTRVDNSGNLVNIGSITASGSATLQGGVVTLGTVTQAGSTVFHDGSSNTGTLQIAALGQNTVYTLPDPASANATICLSTGNCAGSGGGVVGSGTNNQLAKFTATGSTIGDSTISDDGTNVTTSVDLIVQGGDVTAGTTSQLGSFVLHDGNGQSTTLQAGDSTGNLTFVLPTSSGAANQCIKKGTGNQLVFDDCEGGAGGSATLQSAYDNGNTLTTTDARNIDFTLADTTTDATFNIGVATGSTGYFAVNRADGAGTADPAQLMLIDNLDIDRAQPTGLRIQSAGGGLTTAIDVSDAEIGTAISIGSNDILTSGATISATELNLLDGHDVALVDTNDAVATAIIGTGALNSGSITSGFGSIDTGADNIATTGTVSAGTSTTTGNATVGGTLGVTGTTTLSGDLAANGNTTVGNATTDRLTITAQLLGATPLVFQGGTDNSFTTTFAITDPTANQTVTFGDETGTVCLQNSTNCGFAASSGSGNYINNTTTPQTANIAIMSAADASTSLLIRERLTQSADLIRVETNGGTPMFQIDAFGGLEQAAGANFNSTVGIGIPGAETAGTSLRVYSAEGDVVGLEVNANFDQTADVARFNGSDGRSLIYDASGTLKSKGGASQTADLLQLQNNAGNVLSKFNASGQLTLGRITSSGTTQAGSLTLADGTISNFGATLNTTTLTANRTITLPDETGTVCLQNSTNCGFAASTGSGNYIQNQSASDQTADFRISGTGRANTSLLTPLLDTASAAALNVGGTATAINLNENTAVTGTLSVTGNINSSGGALQTNGTTRVDNTGNLTNIGNITGSGALALQSGGTGALTLDTSGAAAASLGATNANAVTISRAGIQTTIQGSATFNESATIGNGAGNDYLEFAEEAGNPACAAGDYRIWANSSDGALKKCQNGTISDLDTTGGGAGTLQDAYNNGNTITTTNARDIAFSLADTATDSNLTVTTATGSTSQTRYILADGAGATAPSELVLIDMQDTNLTLANGLTVSAATGGAITDGIDVADAEIVNAINIGDNNILTSGATISAAELNLLDGHDVALVDTNDAVATAITGTGALNTGSITSGFGSIDVGTDAITTTGTVTGGTVNATSNLQTGGTTRVDSSGNLTNIGNITGTGAITIASTGASNDVIVDGADQFIVQDAAVFNNAVSMDFGGAENLNITNTLTGTLAGNLINTILTNNTSSGTQQVMLLQNAAGSGTTETLLALDNSDTDTAVNSGLIITSAAGGVTTALDVADPEIGTALSFGANDISGTNFSVTGATGNVTSGTINGQTISSASSFTGTVAVTTLGSAGSTAVCRNGSNQLATCASNPSSVTLQQAYDAGNTITTTDARNISIVMADTTTDPNFLIDLQCDTSCSTNGRFAVQDDGTDVFTISPAGGAALFKNSINSTSAFRVQNATATPVLTVDTTNSRVGIGNVTPTESLHVDGKLRFVSSSETAWTGNAKLFVSDQPDSSAQGSLTGTSLTNISTYGNGASAVNGFIMQWGGTTDAGGYKLSDDGMMIWGSGDEDLFALLDEDANAFRLVVDDTGDIGMGIATPNANLHVDGGNASSSTLKFTNGTTTGTCAACGFDVGILSDGTALLNNRPATDLGFATNGTTRMVVDSGGNIGFGTNAPSNALHVDKGTATAGFLQFTAGTTTGTTNVDGMTIGIDNGGAGYLVQWENQPLFFATNSTTRMKLSASGNLAVGGDFEAAQELEVNGDIRLNANGAATVNALCHSGADADGTFADRDIVACNPGTLTDYAEYYPTESDVDYGDVVAIGSELVTVNAGDGYGNHEAGRDFNISKLAKSTQSYQNSLIGVVSKNFGDFTALGQDVVGTEHHPMPIALNGRVPVKVTAENGAIAPGDPLTSSASTPGAAMKATQPGMILGRALGTYHGDGVGHVMVFMSISYYNPPAGGTQGGEGQNIQNGDDVDFASLNVSGHTTLNTLTVTGDAIFQGKVTVKELAVQQDLRVDGHLISGGSTPTVSGGPNVQATVEGTDTAGSITITPASSGSGELAVITFAKPYTAAPRITLTATNANGAKLPIYPEKTATGFKLHTDTPPAAGNTYKYDYIIIE